MRITVQIRSMLLSNPTVTAKIWLDMDVPSKKIMWMILDAAGKQINRDVKEDTFFELQVVSEKYSKVFNMKRLTNKSDTTAIKDSSGFDRIKEEFNMRIQTADGAIWSLLLAEYGSGESSWFTSGPKEAIDNFTANMSSFVNETRQKLEALNPFAAFEKADN